jgi:L-2-hydroxyglutarate oxidase
MKNDLIIIGAGIVGFSTAWQLQRRQPEARILLLEKEQGPAQHQTGHNSGVVHAGVYYEPGSLKAKFCKEGAAATYAFCRKHGLPFERTGKLLVAANGVELERMHSLFKKCQESGLDPEMLSSRQLSEVEPAIAGIGAFLVRESGIVDFPAICREMMRQFVELGGTVRFASRVTNIAESPSEILVQSGNESYSADQLVVCAGLMADRLAKMQGLDIRFRIVPFRGEYYRLRPGLNNIMRHLIYPIPDPALPFLGVHLTRMIDGSITVGPNAVQGWKREGYGAINFSLRDTAEMISFPGFWKLASDNFSHGTGIHIIHTRIYINCPRISRSPSLESALSNKYMNRV